jgi:heme oxygenase
MLSSWTLRELIHRTKAHHADADLVQLQQLGRADTLISYRKHLSKLYGFQRPIHTFYASDPDISGAGLAPPTRLLPLRNDLSALGITAGEPATMKHCPLQQMTSPDSARVLGWFFVTERMALLSTLILRKLKRRLRPEMFESATTYMSACSSQAAARWLQLGVLLDRRRGEVLDRIEEGAHEAFTAQRNWFGSFRDISAAKAS